MTYPPLQGELKVDVMVIGAGLAGVMTAYQLIKEGRSVALLEAKEVASGATRTTTAFVTNLLDTSLPDAKRLWGQEQAKIVVEASTKAIDLIEEIAKREQIKCEFERCIAHIVEGAKTTQVPNQAKFDAIKFTLGLAEVAERLGVKIFEQSEVTKLFEADGVITAITAQGKIEAEYSVVTTNTPFNQPKPLFWRKAKYTSYVLETNIPTGLLEKGIYVDDKNPYHYWRVDAREGYDRLMLGGEDHRADLPVSPKKSFKALERFLYQLVPPDQTTVTERRSGPIIESIDGLPYIGEYAPKQYCATAFAGNGITFSAISSQIITDLIHDRPNSLTDILDPKRGESPARVLHYALHFILKFWGGAVKNTLM